MPEYTVLLFIALVQDQCQGNPHCSLQPHVFLARERERERERQREREGEKGKGGSEGQKKIQTNMEEGWGRDGVGEREEHVS